MTGESSRRDDLLAAGVELTLTSFVVLFQELALIRWVSAEVRVLAYFPNVILISAFLGLGIGAIRAGRKSLLWLWPVALAILVTGTHLMSRIAFTNQSPSEHLWLLYYDIPNAPVFRDVRPPILIIFILSTLSFVALGQVVGERLRDFTAAGATLWGYVADLAGSLLGVIGFAFASFFRTFPVVWFSIFLVAGSWLFARRGWRLAAVYVAVAIGIVASLIALERADRYSPYYALRTGGSNQAAGVVVLANGSLHQYAAPLGPSTARFSPYDENVRAGYPQPYLALGRKPRHVLILGAGTGNDVETALANGAERVDAVEIDPTILDIGRAQHPDHPYDSPRVRVFNTDARAYLRNTRESYDLIVFGTLDSMTRLSALSNVRLDNYVYTVDCMRAARERLTPDGGVALYFMVGNADINRKLVAMLTEAFGRPPIVRQRFHELFNTIYAAGPAWDHLRSPLTPADEAEIERSRSVDIPTDDWPYLYLERRLPSNFYLTMLALLLALSAAALAISSPEMRRSARSIDLEMFLFGAAFLLLETKLVTQMSLVWGTTWVTSAVVFAAILLTILIGTIAMQFHPIAYPVAVAGLVISLLITWAVPVEATLAGGVVARLALSILFAGLPVFFASICFAIRFKAREASNLAFGWNLAGAVFGGLLEFTSMAVGIRAMTLVALIAYLLAFLLERRSAQRAVANT